MVTKEDEKIMESLSDRSRRERSERRRNRRRSGLIFGNIALALGIVVVVLVIRVIALGTPNADKEKAAHKIAEKATATPIATPTHRRRRPRMVQIIGSVKIWMHQSR